MTRKQLDSFAHRVMLAGVDLSRFTFGARRRMAFGFSQPAVTRRAPYRWLVSNCRCETAGIPDGFMVNRQSRRALTEATRKETFQAVVLLSAHKARRTSCEVCWPSVRRRPR